MDWTLVHPERGPQIDGTTKSYDDVERRMGRFQIVVTAVIAKSAVAKRLFAGGYSCDQVAEALMPT